jgi:tetratricopeptide (TPR) repeat protein
VVVLVFLLFAFRAAFAQVPDQARTEVAAGDTAYKLGKFEVALGHYNKAYELYAAPALLFNIGQCHRELGHWERAAFFYEGYLRAMPSDDPNRAFVEGLLKDVKQSLDASVKAAKAEQDRKAADAIRQDELARARLQAQQADALRRAEEARLARERADRDKFYRKWWFWSAVAGVVVAGAGGTAYYFSGETTLVPPTGSAGGFDRR